jgi:hypothetical protein
MSLKEQGYEIVFPFFFIKQILLTLIDMYRKDFEFCRPTQLLGSYITQSQFSE